MSKYSRRKQQLGINHSAAVRQLDRMLIFMLLQELERDTCFVCELKIETREELSIEHKLPWENQDRAAELFFDLDNIAFSHIRCNRPHTYKRIKKVVVL